MKIIDQKNIYIEVLYVVLEGLWILLILIMSFYFQDLCVLDEEFFFQSFIRCQEIRERDYFVVIKYI